MSPGCSGTSGTSRAAPHGCLLLRALALPWYHIGRDGRRRGWQTGVAGESALAVDHQRVLLFGGYGEQPDRAILADLGETALTRRQEVRLVLPSGGAPSTARAIGRGAVLHLFAGAQWWQADLRRLPKSRT